MTSAEEKRVYDLIIFAVEALASGNITKAAFLAKLKAMKANV